MPILCLIGRHGTGKSSIGGQLRSHGYRHISVGLLRRLAQSRQFPADVPALLMSAMGRERPGSLLSQNTARRLVAHACAAPQSVLDGFPSAIEQIELLPANTIFCVVWTPCALRHERLEGRAAVSRRQWTPGRPSERESALAGLIVHLRRNRRCVFVRNSGLLATVTAELLAKVGKS